MKALGRKDTFSMTYRQIEEDGPIYVNMKISRMEVEHYIIIGITNVNAEMRETMTKNRVLAEALASAENAKKERTILLSGMSHRLRTPLNAIIGLDTLALKNENMDEETRDYLEKIKDSSAKLLTIMNEILGSGNADSGVGETSDSDMSLESLSEEERQINKDSMHVLLVDDDPVEVEYSAMMLAEAGIKADYCTNGQEALRRLELQHVKQTPYNLLLLDWNMPGMNGRETAAEVKKLYYNETTVVALTAYNWEDIEQEARSVNVENYLQKPLFSLDVTEKLEMIALRNHINVFKAKKQAKISGRRVLLAEDVQINAEILTDILAIENIKVDHADNGKEAVELFEKSTAGIYAAILMDIRMPVMDGLEAAKTIREMDREDAKRIPIIALTANTFEEDIQLSVQAGMNAHLTKPVETEQLLRVLGELIYEAEH
jgi:CheY-like chemotaxis protein